MIQIKRTGQRLARIVANRVHAARIQAEKFHEVDTKIRITVRKHRKIDPALQQEITQIAHEYLSTIVEMRLEAYNERQHAQRLMIQDLKAYR